MSVNDTSTKRQQQEQQISIINPVITASSQQSSDNITIHGGCEGGGATRLIANQPLLNAVVLVTDEGDDKKGVDEAEEYLEVLGHGKRGGGDGDRDEDADEGDEMSSLIGDQSKTSIYIVSYNNEDDGRGDGANVIAKGVVEGGVGVAGTSASSSPQGCHPPPPPPSMSLLQVQQQQAYYADVCRICHCGPNTLATPTPQVLTPATSPTQMKRPSFSAPPPPPTTIITSVNSHYNLHYGQQNSPPTIIHSPPPSSSPSPPSKKKQQQPPQPPQTPDYNLISPCICSGSLKYVHQCCLQHWIRASNNTACELCKHPYALRSRFKPIWKWESLPMSSREKKRVVCSALFHTVALACVVWSLYVLIDRTIEELTHADLEWQFWTKIIVEAIGCLGAGILTYVWGKSYVGLFVKWISFNRSFVILGKEHRNSIPSPPPSAAPTDHLYIQQPTQIVSTPTQQQPKVTEQQLSPTLQQLPGTSTAVVVGQSPQHHTELIQLIKQL